MFCSPSDRSHPQIKKGLNQSKDRGASYFIWTNGDCWQFYSLALDNAPLYEVVLSSVGDGSEKAESVVSKLSIMEKKQFVENPTIFNEAISNNWKISALPEAWGSLLKQDTITLIQLVRKGLSKELDFKDDEIREFLKTLKPRGFVPPHQKPGRKPRDLSFPEDWEKLLNSYEPAYERARKAF